MRIAGKNRFFFNPKEEKTLDWMARDGYAIYDIEDGEISEGDSLEEISEKDFRQNGSDSRVSRLKGDSRVWMNYSVPRGNYAPNLYNLAWAQGVQNKPLNSILYGSDAQSMRSSSSMPSSNQLVISKEAVKKDDVCSVVIEDSDEDHGGKGEEGEKEEGELEEGEIDLDSEVVFNSEEGIPAYDLPSSNETEIDDGFGEKESEKELKEVELDMRVMAISEVLKSVIVTDVDKTFQRACSQLRISLESLWQLVQESRVPVVEPLIEQAFAGIRAVHSAYCSGSSQQKEQFKDELSRLFDVVRKQEPALFSPEQMEEVEGLMKSLVSVSVHLNVKDMNKEKDVFVSNVCNSMVSSVVADNKSQGLISSKKPNLELTPVHSVGANNGQIGPKVMKLDLPCGSRGRDLVPLINLHADYDESSLPSPTRENPPRLPIHKSPVFEDAAADSQSMVARQEETEDAAFHPYVTDALRAVSSYQQKFGRTSFLSSNRLPSPTPSEECDDGDSDVPQGEVSSAAVSNARLENSKVGVQSTVSTTVHMDSLNGQAPVPGKPVGVLGAGSNPILRNLTKSRDPRLRFANSSAGSSDLNKAPQPVDNCSSTSDLLEGVISSRKQKIVEESVLDGHSLKRQRTGLTDSGVSAHVRMVPGSGDLLEDGSVPGSQPSIKELLTLNLDVDVRKSENGEVNSNKRSDSNSTFHAANGGTQQFPVSGTGSGSGSLPSLLKDIAVNPTMLLHLIMAAEGRQKTANTIQTTMSPSISNALSGSVSSVAVTCSKSSVLEQKPAEKPKNPSQTMNSQSDWGNVRMKPRDPRRILHSNLVQKSENSVPDQFKKSGAILSNVQVGKDNITVWEQSEPAVTNSIAQSTPLPDIAPQFTKTLKNIADIVSTSQANNTPALSSQNVVPPMLPSKTDDADTVVASDDQQKGTCLLSEEASAAPVKLPNPWGDVEHLFEGYDDQQKAAIQRERARRIEEQNKMFAAQKLCLVLDLDHTLLNSAKFVEVEKNHDEILRKKEELDREKPQRHLFRFPHMGMWTKLRPGIWTFLEKASKLYELHLYTMGNKYYATEMAKVLDPTGTLFAGRVISRGDDGDPFDGDERLPKSKDLDGVLGMESAVVIIDDSVRVWPHNKLNLIVVERYTYFPCSRRQFGLIGPSLLEIDHDERPEDGTLASSLAVIERIHQNFFSHRALNDVDVRNILASEQRKILAGCRIVFSRVFPVGEANPHLHPLWQTAEQFGAVCTNQIDDQVTHVVANSLGTDKVNWALSTGRFVVHPGWVEASALLYRRVNERDFAVK